MTDLGLEYDGQYTPEYVVGASRWSANGKGALQMFNLKLFSGDGNPPGNEEGHKSTHSLSRLCQVCLHVRARPIPRIGNHFAHLCS